MQEPHHHAIGHAPLDRACAFLLLGLTGSGEIEEGRREQGRRDVELRRESLRDVALDMDVLDDDSDLESDATDNEMFSSEDE